MKIAILAVTKKGYKTAEKIKQSLPDSVIVDSPAGVRLALEHIWPRYDGIICIMAAGIVVRCISGLCHSKYSDPCVVVIDEHGNFCVSLLSGHIGGGNKLAIKVATLCKGTAVISTASDLSGHTAVDLWSIENCLSIINPERLAATSARLLNSGELKVYQERPYGISFPDDFKLCKHSSRADVVISMTPDKESSQLHLVPRINFIGFGCRRGTSVEEFEQALADIQEIKGVPLTSIAGIASIDLKMDEPALCEIAVLNKWPIRFFSKQALNTIQSPSISSKVFEKVGAWGVCEPAAMLAASNRGKQGHLIIGKMTWERITAAIAQKVY